MPNIGGHRGDAGDWVGEAGGSACCALFKISYQHAVGRTYADKIIAVLVAAIGLGEEFGNEGNGLHAAAAGAGRGAKARPVEPRFEGKGDRSQVCGAPEIYVLVSTIEC